MVYAMESQFERVNKFMSHRMAQMKVLLQQIEDMKCKISVIKDDETIPYVERTERLSAMKQALIQTMNFTLELMKEEVESNDS